MGRGLKEDAKGAKGTQGGDGQHVGKMETRGRKTQTRKVERGDTKIEVDEEDRQKYSKIMKRARRKGEKKQRGRLNKR